MSNELSERGTSGVPASQERAPYPPGYHSSWALVIGINYADHPRINPLQNAEADARALQDLLRDVYGVPNDHIISLLGPEATRENIRVALLDTLADPARIDVNDRVLIFFAGHGVVRAQIDGRAEPEGYLLPADDDGRWAHRIAMQEISIAWKTIPAKHVLCILDACYSGLANLPHRGADEQLRPFDNAMTQYQARQIITAGTSDQRVADVFRTAGAVASQHSYLTHFLVDALQNGLPDGQPITAERLYEYLREQVVAASQNRQRPQFGSYGHEQGVVLLNPPDVQMPRNIYDGLRSPTEPVVQSAIIELRQLFNSVVKLDQPGMGDGEITERWRAIMAPPLLDVLAASASAVVLNECGLLLRDVLIGSPALQQQHAEQLVDLLASANLMRVQQAAAILSALAGDSPGQSAVGPAVQARGRDALEAALAQGSAEVVAPALRAMVKFFPTAALPWLRLTLIDTQAPDDLHFLVFEALPALGSTIDLRLIRQAIGRRPLNGAYRSRATESLLILLAELQRKGALDQLSRAVVAEVLEQALRSDASADVRRRALEALVLAESPALAGLLAAALVDPSAGLREAAYTLIARLPPTDPQIDLMLGSLGERLANEPLALVRASICTALGDVWRAAAALGDDVPIRRTRVEQLAQLLGDALNDPSQDVQHAAARALGASADLAALDTIRGYVARGVLIRRAITPALEDLTEPSELEQISAIVPQMLPELIESFQQLQASAPIDSQEKGHTVVAHVLLMLEAAQVFGEPAFLPLVAAWLEDPPERMLTDSGEPNARAALYIAALEALGRLPRTSAAPLAIEQARRIQADLERLAPALPALIATLVALGGAEALTGLLDLYDALVHWPGGQEDMRIAAANGLLRIAPTAQGASAARQRLHAAAAADPSEQVRQILAQAGQLLSSPE